MNTPTNFQSSRERVAAFIYNRGLRGATDEEIADGLKMRSNTARPRRIELYKRTALCARGTRATRAGNQATVWISQDFVLELETLLSPRGEGVSA